MKLSLAAGFALLLALLVATCVLDYRALSQLQRDQHRIAGFQETRIELAALKNDFIDAETGQRGYLLMGDESYLIPYNNAIEDLQRSNERLKNLLQPMPQLQGLRARMEEVEKTKLAELAETVRLRREKGFDAAMEVVRTNEGKKTMDELRSLTERIATEQTLAMELILQKAEDRKTHAEELLVVTSVILTLALCWLFFHTRRNLAERERLLASEQEAKIALEKALAAERAAHSEAAHANKLKDEFLAVVSHELRTPLNAIVGWTNLLREGADEKEMQDGFASIERNAYAQARLVDDLLDISRIVSGKLHLTIGAVDLQVVARSVVEALRPASNARGIAVTIQPAEVSTFVSGDADRLQQIAWNLVSNAIKFTPRGGSVKITFEHVASDVAMEVADTGQGISADFLPRIFDRFSQQDSSTTRGHGGLGLGLSISRHLAELHGGKILVSSEGADKGSVFRLQIPVMAVQETESPAATRETATDGVAAPKAPQKSIKNLRILAVDDQNDALDVVSRVLTRVGAEVRTADSARAARAILAGWQPDLIISDIGMPEQDGYSLIREVRNSKDSTLRNVPAIALTAFARETDRHRAIGAGFNDHLSKPVQARILIEKAAEIAGHV